MVSLLLTAVTLGCGFWLSIDIGGGWSQLSTCLSRRSRPVVVSLGRRRGALLVPLERTSLSSCQAARHQLWWGLAYTCTFVHVVLGRGLSAFIRAHVALLTILFVSWMILDRIFFGSPWKFLLPKSVLSSLLDFSGINFWTIVFSLLNKKKETTSSQDMFCSILYRGKCMFCRQVLPLLLVLRMILLVFSTRASVCYCD